MRILTVVVLSAAVATGTAGAVVAYDLATVAPEPAASGTNPPDEPARQQQRAVARPRFAPCTPPAKLERGVCVTDEVRTVVIPGAQVQQAPALPQAQVARVGSGRPPSDQFARENEPLDDHEHDDRDDDFDDDFDDSHDDSRDDSHDDSHDGDDDSRDDTRDDSHDRDDDDD